LEDIVAKLKYTCSAHIKPKIKWTVNERQTFQGELARKGISKEHFNILETLSRTDQIDYQVILNYIWAVCTSANVFSEADKHTHQ
jgi:hypothetical protein